MLPLIPVNEQNNKVNQLMLSFIPVTNEMRLTAKREPRPERVETVNDLKKCPERIILIRQTVTPITAVRRINFAPSGICHLFGHTEFHI